MIRIPGTCSSCSAYVEGRNTMGDTMARSAADGKAAQ